MTLYSKTKAIFEFSTSKLSMISSKTLDTKIAVDQCNEWNGTENEDSSEDEEEEVEDY